VLRDRPVGVTPLPHKPSLQAFVEQTVGPPDAVTKLSRSYEFNLRSAQQAVASGETIRGILLTLSEMRSRYANGDPQLLFYPADPASDLRFHQKPFESVLVKMYRGNVLFNRRYPEPPDRGIIDFTNLYERMDDLLRTRIVCKYMDGPKFVCSHLSSYCKALNVEHRVRELSTDAGYYAWHFYFKAPVELMPLGGEVEAGQMWVEIQLSTQLAEVITSLTHGLYEQRREGRAGISDTDWKWDAQSQYFRSAYIGHGLHLLEGIIQAFRDDVFELHGAGSTNGEDKIAAISTPQNATIWEPRE
jgi:hypothetical protein